MTTSLALSSVIGPFFDYTARMKELRDSRDSYARLAARAILDGDKRGMALYSELFLVHEKKIDALGDWFGPWSETEARWIGWDIHNGFTTSDRGE
jgi:restriction endonuclease Mrr